MRENLRSVPIASRIGAAFLLIALTFLVDRAQAQQRYAARGLVLELDKQHRAMTVSCEEISGYMDAMVMPIEVRDVKDLQGVVRGSVIEFTLVVDKESSHAEDIRIRNFESLELDPLSARRLRLLDGAMDPSLAPGSILETGQPAPDFSLTDQNRQRVTLSQFAGQVVVVTFVYTRCPFPNYCFRLSNNLARLQRRFAPEMGHKLTLLSVTLDPVHDQPEALAEYGRIWKVDAKGWHLLTGPPAEIRKFCERFGVGFFPDEGQFIHSLHTLIIDRQGRLAANLEGNEFTAEQLGDLVESVMKTQPTGR